MLLVSDIFGNVRDNLNDSTVGAYRWSDATLIRLLNTMIAEIVNHNDEAYVVRKAVQLNGGTAFQTGVLPNDGTLVKTLGITRNLTQDPSAVGGFLPGKAIVKVASIETMDRSRRGWYTATHATQIENWIPAGEDYQNFFCYPPPTARVPVWVEAHFTQIPPALAATTDVIPIKDKFRFLMEIGTTGRALMQDIPQGDAPRGKVYLDTFYAVLKG